MTTTTGRSISALAGSAWDGSTLVIDNPDAIKRIRRKEISPSTMSAIRKCEASFAADSVLPRADDPFQPFKIGTGAHEAMEHLFTLPPAERVPDFIHQEVARIRDETWDMKHLDDPERRVLLLPDAGQDFHASTEITDALVEANAAAAARWERIVLPWSLGIFAMTGQPHPSEVDVFGNELAVGGWDFEKRQPNPLKLSLPGLQGPFPVQGKIDRTDWVTLDNGQRGLSVRDYKFPAKKPRAPRRDGDDYADQQRVYSMMFQALHPELPVVDAALLYPGWDHTRGIDISQEALTRTRLQFERAWLAMNRAADSQRFSTSPSALCGWCPLVNACPVAKVTTDNAASQAATKPSGAELGITVVKPANRPTPWSVMSDYSRLPITNGVQPVQPPAPAEQPAQQQIAAPTAPSMPAPEPVNQPAPSTASTVHRGEGDHNEGNAPMTSPTTQYPASAYAAMNAFSTVDAAIEHLVEQGIDLTPTTVDAMSTIVAELTEHVTRTLFESFDWGHDRTSRIGFTVRAAIKTRPAPLRVSVVDHEGHITGFRTGTAAEWADWKVRVTGLSLAKAKVALAIVSGQNPLTLDAAIAALTTHEPAIATASA